jgi:catechol 2,3-dioxygenase-like lactoylglutathione lyase family enzyme
MEFKFELVLIPVTDVDRAKEFYTEQLGFDLLIDTPVGDRMRVVQVTPSGSACSIGFGTGLMDDTEPVPTAACTWSFRTSWPR